MGQRISEFGQRNGKMYYKIQKDISKKYSGTGPGVIVTLGPTPYSKGPVPCSEARGVCFNYRMVQLNCFYKRYSTQPIDSTAIGIYVSTPFTNAVVRLLLVR